jgi:ribosomal protein S6
MKEWAMKKTLEGIERGDDEAELIASFFALDNDQQTLLLKRVGGSKSRQAGRFLALLHENVSEKSLQKQIKKALFQLKSRGVSVEDVKPTGDSVLAKTIQTVREAHALMSSYDAELTRVLVTAFELKKNQFALTHTALHFSKGLTELRSLPVSRIEMEQIMGEYISRTQPPVLLQRISPPYAGYVVEEASLASGKDVDEARSLRRYLSEAKGDIKKPEDIRRLGDEPNNEAAALDIVIIDEVFEPFRLDWKGAEEDKSAFDSAVSPSIVLPPYIAQERREAFLKNLLENERFRDIILRFRRMLEDTAYLFFQQGRRSYGKSLVTAVQDERATNKALVYFAQKTFQDLNLKSEQSRDLIVDPFAPPKGGR